MGTHSDAATRGTAKSLSSANATPAANAATSPLKGSVGVGGDNRPDDVRLVSGALAANDRLASPTDSNSLDLEAKITTFQQDMGDNLKPDGLIKPGGPTERRFTDLARAGLMKAPSVPAGPAKSVDGNFARPADLTPNPSEEKDGTPAKAWARIQKKKRQDAQAATSRAKEAEAAERRAEKKRAQVAKTMAEHQRQLADRQAKARQTKRAQLRAATLSNTVTPANAGGQTTGAGDLDSRLRGNDEKGQTPSSLSPLSDDVMASNTRAARYLAGRTGVGDYPRFVADGLTTNPTGNALAETVDLIDQTRAINSKQADALLKRLGDLLPEDQTRTLTQALDTKAMREDTPIQPDQPSAPSEPSAPDDDTDGFSGPCGDLAWATYEANQALMAVRRDNSAIDRRIMEIEDEITRLERDLLADAGEATDSPDPGRLPPDERRGQNTGIPKIVRRKPWLSGVLTGADILGVNIPKEINRLRYRQEIEQLEVEKAKLETELGELVNKEDERNQRALDAAAAQRACQERHRKN